MPYPVPNRGIYHLWPLCILFILALSVSARADYPDGYYEVGEVIEGDMFVLKDGKKVRLTGIDAPGAGSVCFNEARERLSSLISGKRIYMKRDVSDTDQSGMLLRYVFTGDTLINYSLIYSGFAWAVENPPNTQYSFLLADAEKAAREAKNGCLWGDHDGFFMQYDDTNWHIQGGCFIALHNE